LLQVVAWTIPLANVDALFWLMRVARPAALAVVRSMVFGKRNIWGSQPSSAGGDCPVCIRIGFSSSVLFLRSGGSFGNPPRFADDENPKSIYSDAVRRNDSLCRFDSRGKASSA
jgi:hypothetical protein